MAALLAPLAARRHRRFIDCSRGRSKKKNYNPYLSSRCRWGCITVDASSEVRHWGRWSSPVGHQRRLPYNDVGHRGATKRRIPFSFLEKRKQKLEGFCFILIVKPDRVRRVDPVTGPIQTHFGWIESAVYFWIGPWPIIVLGLGLIWKDPGLDRTGLDPGSFSIRSDTGPVKDRVRPGSILNWVRPGTFSSRVQPRARSARIQSGYSSNQDRPMSSMGRVRPISHLNRVGFMFSRIHTLFGLNRIRNLICLFSGSVQSRFDRFLPVFHRFRDAKTLFS